MCIRDSWKAVHSWTAFLFRTTNDLSNRMLKTSLLLTADITFTTYAPSPTSAFIPRYIQFELEEQQVYVVRISSVNYKPFEKTISIKQENENFLFTLQPASNKLST